MIFSLLKHTNLPLALSLIFVLSLFNSGSSYAEENVRYYDFEVIIYESLDPQAKLSEVWKRDLSREIPETFVSLNQPYPGLFPKQYIPKYTFKYLPRKSLQLREEAKLLNESDNYRVLLHTSWRQPGMAEDVALPIHITKKFITRAEDPFSNTRDPDMPAVNLPAPVQRPIESQSTLDGYIKIILKRYLHANFDLVYTTNRPVVTTTSIAEESTATEDDLQSDEEADTEETVLQEPVLYRLQQTRKMRSKEVHYIDHPVLGVIILATPFKLKQ